MPTIEVHFDNGTTITAETENNPEVNIRQRTHHELNDEGDEELKGSGVGSITVEAELRAQDGNVWNRVTVDRPED